MSDREAKLSFRKGSINQEGAIVVQGMEAKVKASAVFTQHHIPPGLFPLATIEEFGHNDQTGLFWMKQKTKTTNEFAHAELVAMYNTSVSGHVEKNRVKNLKGFKMKEMKGRELYLSVPYDEIFIDDDEVHLRSRTHTTRNCMLVSFSANPPPPPHRDETAEAPAAPPAALPQLAEGEAAAPPAEGEGEGEAEGEGENSEKKEEEAEGDGEQLAEEPA